MEASALPASATLTRPRISIGVPLLRLRSDEQLVNLFRGGNEDAFRVIYDRYRQRLFAYARQMLGGSTDDAEDALQEIFVRAYAGLRSSHSELALRAWLYRIAHNRCVDLLRRPPRPDFGDIELVRPPSQDPAARAEQRDALKRLVIDVQRLPDQQRSALLMRELGGMPYSDLAGALEVSVPAVKSLLVRARVGLAQAEAARDTACASIRDDVLTAHDRGVRLSGMARRHMRDCPGCREFRGEVRGLSRQLAAFIPALGPLGLVAKFLGLGGSGGAAGASAGGGAAAGGGALAAAGSGGTAAASAGVLATGAGHVVTLLAAAVVTAGGAVEVQNTLAPAIPHRATHHHVATVIRPAAETQAPANDAVAAPVAVNPLPAHHAYAAPDPTSKPTHHRVAAKRPPATLPAVDTTPLSSDSSPSTPSDPSATDTTLAGNGSSPDSSSTTYGSGPGTTSATGTQSGSPQSSSTSSSTNDQSASGPYAYDASQTPPTTVSSGTQPTSSSGSSSSSGSGSGPSAASGSGTTSGK